MSVQCAAAFRWTLKTHWCLCCSITIVSFFLVPNDAWAQSVHSPNTMQLAEGTQSPPAKIEDLHWISGSWTGEALGGTFEETWNPPLGDSMMGLFRLVKDGKTQFSEIMSIVPQGDSLVLKLKHFHADLKGWEEQDKTVDFPLVQVTSNEANFRGLTFRKLDSNRLNIYVAIKEGDRTSELEFAARRSQPTSSEHLPSDGATADAIGQSKASQQTTLSDGLAEIDGYIIKVQKDWEVPGLAVAVVHDNKILMSKGFGIGSLDTQQPVTEDTLFAIASNSKAFTAAALGILVDDGKLAWDDAVVKYLPEFQMPDPWVTREITVRDLLCHRSGMDTFSGDLLWYDTNYTADEIVDRIRFLKPTSSFRSRYGYQNLMFIVAGKVIERVSGKTWAEFVQQRILDPTGMGRTTTSVTQLKDNYALPHNRSGGGELRVLPLGNVDNSWGACGLNSSVNDLARWMLLQLAGGELDGKRVISEQRLQELWQPNTVQSISPAMIAAEPSRNFQTYGLGYALHDWHGRKVVSHSGGLDGMISQLAMIPSEKLGVVVLTNSESSASRFIRDRIIEYFLGVENRRDKSAEAIAKLAAADQAAAQLRDQQEAARRSKTAPTIPLIEFSGKYHSQLYGDVHISLSDDRLVLRMEPAPNFVADLEHWHFNTFQIKWRDSVKYNFPRGFVNFTLDSNARPHQLVIDQPNDDFWFYELELFRQD